MIKKFFAALIMSFVFFTFITGCQNYDRPSVKNPVTLTMWHNYGGAMQQSMDELIDEFNSTVGKENGIVINVKEISSSSELNESLKMIVNGDPGAPEMPDIFTGYPQIAVKFHEKGMLANLDNYFSSEDLSNYVDAFISEGRLSDGGLYVFPLAKSTEILFLNQTLFDMFADATGADIDKLTTFEGIAELSKKYYDWTDEKTPNVPFDGKAFYAADSWFNVAQVGMVQLEGNIFNTDNKLSLKNYAYSHIFNTIYKPATEGGFAVYDGYSSDLSKTGDIICSTGSSAGILFYGDTITYQDGTVEMVEYSFLPYPVFEGGQKIALQRGGGLIVAKTNERKEYAAAVFLKWFTASEQNMKFISKTGYLPVTKKAFESGMTEHLRSADDSRIKKMLTTVTSMYEGYEFFTAPNFSGFDEISKTYETEFKGLMKTNREAYLDGRLISATIAFSEFTE